MVLAAVGSRGDVAPFGALAERLLRRGHDVVLLTHAALATVVPDGVRVVGVAGDPHDLLAGPAGRAVRRGSPRALNRARHLFADYLHSFYEPAADMLRGGDVLIASTFAVAPVHAAMVRSVPVVRVHLWPETVGVDGPMPLLPYSWAMPRAVRRSARRALRSFEGYLGGVDGWWQRGRLHLVAQHPVSLTTATLGTLHAYSPRIVPPVAPDICVSGWWTTPRPGQLSAQTLRALDAGGDWIYVGFGSMPQGSPERVLEAVTDACRRLGVRAMVQVGGMSGSTFPEILCLDYEPHDALFARMSAVVHHGGSGTTGAAVRAGVPSVVVPHVADQYFWGHRLHRVGVAPRSLPRPFLSARRLAARIDQARCRPLVTRAGQFGEQVRAEDGTGVAVRYVERLLAERSRR